MATEVEAQITGTVFQLSVAVGAHVSEGDELLVLESMKMEIPVEAPCAGAVRAIHVSEGDGVEEGDVLAVIG
jgi:acetyl-CoA carboxylase biotin carboxyl carrier protein